MDVAPLGPTGPPSRPIKAGAEMANMLERDMFGKATQRHVSERHAYLRDGTGPPTHTPRPRKGGRVGEDTGRRMGDYNERIIPTRE